MSGSGRTTTIHVLTEVNVVTDVVHVLNETEHVLYNYYKLYECSTNVYFRWYSRLFFLVSVFSYYMDMIYVFLCFMQYMYCTERCEYNMYYGVHLLT